MARKLITLAHYTSTGLADNENKDIGTMETGMQGLAFKAELCRKFLDTNSTNVKTTDPTGTLPNSNDQHTKPASAESEEASSDKSNVKTNHRTLVPSWKTKTCSDLNETTMVEKTSARRNCEKFLLDHRTIRRYDKNLPNHPPISESGVIPPISVTNNQ